MEEYRTASSSRIADHWLIAARTVDLKVIPEYSEWDNLVGDAYPSADRSFEIKRAASVRDAIGQAERKVKGFFPKHIKVIPNRTWEIAGNSPPFFRLRYSTERFHQAPAGFDSQTVTKSWYLDFLFTSEGKPFPKELMKRTLIFLQTGKAVPAKGKRGASPQLLADRYLRRTAGNLPEEPVVGDILYSNWGYDQTNIDYYQIIRATPKQVILQQLQKKVVSVGRTDEKVVPLKGKFDPREKKLRRKWRPGFNGGISVSLTSYSGAHSWDGRPISQTRGGFGH